MIDHILVLSLSYLAKLLFRKATRFSIRNLCGQAPLCTRAIRGELGLALVGLFHGAIAGALKLDACDRGVFGAFIAFLLCQLVL